MLSFLNGETKNATRGFSIQGSNYKTVLKVLKTRYGDKKSIISQLVGSLNSLSVNGTGLNVIKKYLDRTYENYQQLVNLETNIEEEQLMNTVEQRLPVYILKKLSDRHCLAAE